MSREYPIVREVRLRTENCSLWWEGFMKQVGLRPGIKDKGGTLWMADSNGPLFHSIKCASRMSTEWAKNEAINSWP